MISTFASAAGVSCGIGDLLQTVQITPASLTLINTLLNSD